ncbi:DUF192 domain-containing protein [Hyalangium rubrum]|uniref:DUF192 domain-containing protein n=1 Tax=Hyalangium rubrum TaxID=3103134 RepID=A0ABU5GWD4_9BACT|nr:DUF192 domain-containing protein [Hyalangium sp. s54d21]MDY7225401.1 DUF192 domain-containing protein [Hyalangium sp. s54d21]
MTHTCFRGLLAALLLLACQAPEAEGKPPAAPRPAPTDVTDKDYEMPPLPRAYVRLKDAFGGVHRVEVEVVATPLSRQRGLMWRTELAAGKGMLFLFPVEEVQSFWMRNTLIPLDILFINTKNQVVGIIERAEPKTTTPRSVGIPSQFVLEVPGGWCQSVGITKGGTVEFEGVSAIPIIP